MTNRLEIPNTMTPSEDGQERANFRINVRLDSFELEMIEKAANELGITFPEAMDFCYQTGLVFVVSKSQSGEHSDPLVRQAAGNLLRVLRGQKEVRP